MIIKTKDTNGAEKLTINCFAVFSEKENKILVFLDDSIPGYKKQLAEYEKAGFVIVPLNGTTRIERKKITFTEEQVIEKLDPYFMRESIDVIVRKLGF